MILPSFFHRVLSTGHQAHFWLNSALLTSEIQCRPFSPMPLFYAKSNKVTDEVILELPETQPLFQLVEAADALARANTLPPLQSTFRQSGRITDWHDIAVDTGLDEIGRTGVARGDNRQAAGERFRHHKREAILN